jgi:VanZ family protein
LITATMLRTACLLLALAWAALIWYLSDQPGLDIPQAVPMQDKLLHLVAYGVLGFLAMGTRRLPLDALPAGTYWKVCLLCALYGILDEYHQSFVPGRDATVYDVYADVMGALLGAWLFTALPRAVRAGNT